MSVRFLLIASVAAFLLCGCRNDPRTQLYLDNVNAEKRLLEDTLYDLQYDYECSMDEVERLRRELAQSKPGVPGSSSSIRGGSSTKTGDSATTPADEMFPDLKPPTVESGTPDRTPPPPSDAPPKSGDTPDLDDIDDLEPPKLDLGDEQNGASATEPSTAPRVAQREPGVPVTAPEKPSSRWTPRAPRDPEPAQRASVADRSRQATETTTPSSSPINTETADTAGRSGGASGAAATQARRPQWRPQR